MNNQMVLPGQGVQQSGQLNNVVSSNDDYQGVQNSSEYNSGTYIRSATNNGVLGSEYIVPPQAQQYEDLSKVDQSSGGYYQPSSNHTGVVLPYQHMQQQNSQVPNNPNQEYNNTTTLNNPNSNNASHSNSAYHGGVARQLPQQQYDSYSNYPSYLPSEGQSDNQNLNQINPPNPNLYRVPPPPPPPSSYNNGSTASYTNSSATSNNNNSATPNQGYVQMQNYLPNNDYATTANQYQNNPQQIDTKLDSIGAANVAQSIVGSINSLINGGATGSSYQNQPVQPHGQQYNQSQPYDSRYVSGYDYQATGYPQQQSQYPPYNPQQIHNQSYNSNNTQNPYYGQQHQVGNTQGYSYQNYNPGHLPRQNTQHAPVTGVPGVGSNNPGYGNYQYQSNAPGGYDYQYGKPQTFYDDHGRLQTRNNNLNSIPVNTGRTNGGGGLTVPPVGKNSNDINFNFKGAPNYGVGGGVVGNPYGGNSVGGGPGLGGQDKRRSSRSRSKDRQKKTSVLQRGQKRRSSQSRSRNRSSDFSSSSSSASRSNSSRRSPAAGNRWGGGSGRGGGGVDRDGTAGGRSKNNKNDVKDDDPNSSFPQPPNLKDGDWECRFCSNWNWAKRDLCNQCKRAKTEKRRRDNSPNRSTTKYKTHRYSRENSVEGRRDREQQQIIHQEGDWICARCQNLNYSYRFKCNRCQIRQEQGMLRPEIKEKKRDENNVVGKFSQQEPEN